MNAVIWSRVKNPGASPEAFKNMNSPHEEKPKQASGYQTQRESKLEFPIGIRAILAPLLQHRFRPQRRL
jgi:hypothetical protein